MSVAVVVVVTVAGVATVTRVDDQNASVGELTARGQHERVPGAVGDFGAVRHARAGVGALEVVRFDRMVIAIEPKVITRVRIVVCSLLLRRGASHRRQARDPGGGRQKREHRRHEGTKTCRCGDEHCETDAIREIDQSVRWLEEQ